MNGLFAVISLKYESINKETANKMRLIIISFKEDKIINQFIPRS
jgi:hypothetical protein